MNYTTETTAERNETGNFFDTYSQNGRIALESLLAILATITNLTAFVLTKAHHHHHYAYYALFKHLTMANLLAAISSWASNNLLFFFFKAKLTNGMEALCRAMFILLVANIVHTVFAVVAAFQLLGFSIVQLIAISKPFQFNSITSVRNIRLALASVWGVCATAALVPICKYLMAYGLSTDGIQEQLNYIDGLNTFATNTSIAVLLVIYVCIISLCAWIYYIIHRLQDVLSAGFHESHSDIHYEQKTFRSILILVLTMTTFTIPYCVMYLITSHTSHGRELTSNTLVFYYMTLLPYFKIASDPIIYRRGVILLKCNPNHRLQKCRYFKRNRFRHPPPVRRLPPIRDRVPTSNKKSVINYRVTTL